VNYKRSTTRAIDTVYLRINWKKIRAYCELFGQFLSKGSCVFGAKGADALATLALLFYVFKALAERLP
jgi:hypothetical protein